MAAITPLNSVNYCFNDGCQKPAPNRCGRCKLIFYCGVDCQKIDWSRHKITCNPSSSVKVQAQGAKVLNPEKIIAADPLLKEAIKEIRNSTILSLFGFLNVETICRQYLSGTNCYSLGSGDGQLELIAKSLWNINMIGIDPDGLKFGRKNKFFLKPEFNDFKDIPLDQITPESNIFIPWPSPSIYRYPSYDIDSIVRAAEKIKTIVVIFERSGGAGSDQLLRWINSLNPELAVKTNPLIASDNSSKWPKESFGIKHRFILQEVPLDSRILATIQALMQGTKASYEIVVIEKNFKGKPCTTELKVDKSSYDEASLKSKPTN